MSGLSPRKALLLPLLSLAAALLLSGCEGGSLGYRNPCDSRPTFESRQACNNSLIDFDRQLRGNRAYRTL